MRFLTPTSASNRRPRRRCSKRPYLVSFIGQDAGEATFVGLYRIAGHRALAPGEVENIAEYQVLATLGVVPPPEQANGGHLYFDLESAEAMADWSGPTNLQVATSGPILVSVGGSQHAGHRGTGRDQSFCRAHAKLG